MIKTNIDDYDPSELIFSPEYEEFESIRHPEDGEPLFGKHIFIRAEAPNGMRWYRTVGIIGWEVDNTIDEDGYEVFVRRTTNECEVKYKAIELFNRLKRTKTPKLNPKVWSFAGACYGSEAYQILDIESEIVAWERRSDDAYYC